MKNTPEDKTTESTLVEEAKEASFGTPYKGPVRTATVDSELQRGRLRVVNLLGSQEKETAEKASFMKHISCPS